MVYTSDLEEYLRLRQILQPSSEKHNSHAETSAMQPPPPFAGQSPLPFTDWPLHDPSMSYASTFLDSSWTMPTQPPAFAIEHRPVPSTNWPLYDPSMSHVSRSLHPGRTIHPAIGHPTADNFYQSNMQSSPIMQYRDNEVGTEDHFSPGQTTTHTWSWSLTPSPSTQKTSPSNQHNEVVDLESTSVHGKPQQQDEADGPFKCGWAGCTRRETFSSHASLMRHIKVQHVAHRSVKCPECGQAFGRVDNMKEHRGRRHRMFD